MDWRQAAQRFSCVLMLSAAALPLAAIAPAPATKTCDALMQWARDNRESLPRDYRGLLAYPLEQRRAIFTGLTAEQKAAFWSDKIAAYLEQHPELGARQRSAVAEAEAFLRPDVYRLAETADPETKARLELELARLEERVASGLGESAMRQLLYGLGPDAREQSAPLAGVMFCDCSKNRDCDQGAICVPPPFPCEVVPTGCGTGGVWPCELVCKLIDPKR